MTAKYGNYFQSGILYVNLTANMFAMNNPAFHSILA